MTAPNLSWIANYIWGIADDVQDDLELLVPGGSYLEHSGRERAWPTDEEGRFLPLYRNNDFGGNKPYRGRRAERLLRRLLSRRRLRLGPLVPLRRDVRAEDVAPGAAARGRRVGGSADRRRWPVRRVPSRAAACAVLAGRPPQPGDAGGLRFTVGEPLDRELVPAGGDGWADRRLARGGDACRAGRIAGAGDGECGGWPAMLWPCSKGATSRGQVP